jgi:hypothetical protein
MKIMLNKRLYEAQAIKKAVKDFKNTCKCKIVKESPFDVEVEIEAKDNTGEEVKGEFCNYILGLMKNEEGLYC